MNNFREALTRLVAGEHSPELFFAVYQGCFHLCMCEQEEEILQCIKEVTSTTWIAEHNALETKHCDVLHFLSSVRLIPAGGALVQHVILMHVKEMQEKEMRDFVYSCTLRTRYIRNACLYLERIYLSKQNVQHLSRLDECIVQFLDSHPHGGFTIPL